MKKIIDQFTGLEMSRQRKWQLRRQAEGKCIICGKNAKNRFYCQEHILKINKRNKSKV